MTELDKLLSAVSSSSSSILVSEELVRLQQAVALYQRSFMEGFFLDGCSAYEEWQLFMRERLQRRVLDALHRLSDRYEQRGDYHQALQSVWRQLELEAWLDQAHRRAMRLLTLTGEPGLALAHYEKYCRLLKEELEGVPLAETTHLYEQIKAGQLAGEVTRTRGPTVLSMSVNSPTDLSLIFPPVFLTQTPPQNDTRSPLLARQQELDQLKTHLSEALAGQGRVIFVTGDAGAGKTALLRTFAQFAQELSEHLLVANGNCNAYTGLGDPYLPFRDIFSQLTGDIEARWTAGAMTRAQALRLWRSSPLVIQWLASQAPDLIATFLHKQSLLEQLNKYLPNNMSWLTQLREDLLRQASDTARAGNLLQTDLFKQVTVVLQTLARRQPLLLLLDDLQWADVGSTSLLFHLGRRLIGSQILIIGAFRPEEVALGRNGDRHPLDKVVHEFQRDFGSIKIDLDQADRRGFIEALLDIEPNHLDRSFREKFYYQSQGHPLFTIELLQEMKARGDLIYDEAGHWIAGANLDWHALPARVEAAIAERINRLPQELQQVLTIASVEGEQFTAEVVAELISISCGSK